MNWLHGTPVGETPGWKGERWFFFELGQSNIWNAPLEMKDRKTGKTYTYEADYEQTTAVLEIGTAIEKKMAISLELPFAHRSGGFLDDFIEEFHDLLGTRHFNRHLHGQNRSRFKTSTDGAEGYKDKDLTGISNIKPKLKWWAIHCKKSESPACGVALSTQLKVPLQNNRQGGTNEKLESSMLLHFGFPIFSRLDFWATAGYTRLRRDENMPGWPLLKNHTMFEINFDFAINDKWGIMLMARTDSPYLDRERLEYIDSATNARTRSNNRAASAWNSLIRWQGAESIGVRYRKKNTQTSVQLVEDWGIGNYDAANDIYSNGAPDFNFVIQTSWTY